MRNIICFILFCLLARSGSSQYAINLSAGMEVIDYGKEVLNYEAIIVNTDKFLNYGVGLRITQNSKIHGGNFIVNLNPYSGNYEEQGSFNSIEGFATATIKIKGLGLIGYAGYCSSTVNTTGYFYLFNQSQLIETLTYDKEYTSILYPRLGIGLQYEVKLFGNLKLVPKFQYLNDLKSQQNEYQLISNNEVSSNIINDIAFPESNPSTRILYHESKYFFVNIGLSIQL